MALFFFCFRRRTQKKPQKPTSRRAPAAEPAPIPAIPLVDSREVACEEEEEVLEVGV